MTGGKLLVTPGSSDVRSSEKEIVKVDKREKREEKREVKRLERKKKKFGKLSKEENVALDLLYHKRKNLKNKSDQREIPEEGRHAVEIVPTIIERDEIRDEYDEHFDYNTAESIPVMTGESLDYLTFNFEGVITEEMEELMVKFDYNSVQAVWTTDVGIDYSAPIPSTITNTGYTWFH